MTTLLGISGALRKKSTNTYLIRNAAEMFGADTYIEADLHLPLYDGDVEAATGVPASVQALSDQIAAADAIVIGTPEYNKSIPGVLKNALDWVSRTPGNPWKDKPIAIMTASAGRAGGERAQFALRLCMVPFRPHLLQGPELLVAGNAEQFDNDGRLINVLYRKQMQDLMDQLKALI